jgi:hypothetical protein
MPLSDEEDAVDEAVSKWLGVAKNSFEEYGPDAYQLWYETFTVSERRHMSAHDNHIDALNGNPEAIALMTKFLVALVTRRLQ